MIKYAQKFQVKQSWLRKWISKIFPMLTKTQRFNYCTAEVSEDRLFAPKKTLEASSIWEQINFDANNVQIEKDCKLISKLPASDPITIYADKQYWIVFPAFKARNK
jgi:hypothetical protein